MTSKSVAFSADSEFASKPTSAHFTVLSVSLCAVSAMLPPSAISMPYFCSALATTCAAGLSEAIG